MARRKKKQRKKIEKKRNEFEFEILFRTSDNNYYFNARKLKGKLETMKKLSWGI